jgi:histidinol-phosphatase
VTTGDDLEVALALADIADAITLPAFQRGEHRIEIKDDGTPVTDTDLAVEAAMLDFLATVRSTDGILGEEGGQHGPIDRRWILDPIDGTTGFIEGTPSWGSQIALEVDSVCVLGVTSAPEHDARWWGEVGVGAFRRTPAVSDEPITVATEHCFVDAIACRHPPGADPTPVGDRMGELFELYEARPHGVLLVAEGVVDICVQDRGAPWDYGAFSAIVTAAGGRFSYLDGSTEVTQTGPGLFTNGLLHDEVLDALRGLDTRT